MSFTSLGTGLNTAMSTLVGASKEVAACYNYDVKLVTAYPVITIVPANGEETYLDQQDNNVTYYFKIRLINSSDNTSTTEAKSREIADDMLKALRDLGTVITLSSGITYRITRNWVWGWSGTDNQEPQRVFEITVNCQAVIPI